MAERIERAFSIFNEGHGRAVLKHLKEKFPGKFVEGDKDQTYNNMVQAEVINYIERLAILSRKVKEERNGSINP